MVLGNITAARGLFLLPILLLALAGTLRAQSSGTANLNGYVVDSLTRETLVAATVSVKGTKLGARTNKSGFFAINNIPSGKQAVVISYIGYQRKEIEMTFAENEAQKVTIELASHSVQSKDVVVEADKEIEKREISISKVDIPIQQLQQLRIGGEADIFRSLQFLPGVLTSSQISSGLYIRGGSPDQNLVLIDGSNVYNPTHLFGFFSTFNPDAIKDVDLIKGGFPAEYGGRLSAVVDLTQKDGNKNEFEGDASLGLISARLSLQGPIGNGSWFIGGRRTYLDILLGLVPKDPDNPLPNFGFYDVNAKISQSLSPNDIVFLSGFASSDKLTYDATGVSFGIGISNRTGAARWTHLFGDNLFSVVNLSTSRYESGFNGDQSGYAFNVNNQIQDYTGKASLEWFASNSLTFKTGVEITKYQFDYIRNMTGTKDSTAQSGTNEGGSTNLTVNDWTYAAYGQANYQFTDLLSLQLGLRADRFQLADRTTLDPRVALRYQLQENIALKAAWGIYHQYLRLASLPDFSFFDTWMPTDSTVNPSRSIHYVLSLETEPFTGYNFNVDLYYKTLNDISEFNQFQTMPKNVSDVFFSGNGQSYGAEFFLQKKVGDLTGWIGYALGWVQERFDSINEGREFRPKYDRRHDLKIVAQYKFNDRWEVGASFVFQSGQSYTGSSSRFRALLPGQQQGSDLTVPLERYGLRLPPSHQLNINANYSSTIFGLPMRLLIDIYNVYSRRDIWFRYYDTSKDITEVTDFRLLPILPTVSIEVKF